MNMIDNDSVITVRVCSEVKEKLLMESKKKSITLNALIGQVLIKHIKWDMFVGDVGLIFLTKSCFKNFLQQMDEKAVRAISSSVCKEEMRNATIFLKEDVNIDNFLEVFDMWLESSHIPFRHIINTKHHYVMQHDLGRKWSIYITTMTAALLADMGYKMINQKIEDHSITFTIEQMPK